MIKQIFVPYWEWEDYLSGMWRKVEPVQESKLLIEVIEFTGDWVKYGNAMGEVIDIWPRTMLNTLTNKSVNRRAFLGHCAVQYKINCPEYITRQAWGMLTDKQRFDADLIAEKHIKHWEYEFKTKNRDLYKGLGEQMLFQWPA
jgi:hypothetical protein